MKPLAAFVSMLLLAGCATAPSRLPAEPDFARVQVGMTHEDALRILGKPFETMPFPRSHTEAWDYRFVDAWGYLSAFSVIFGPQGTVVSTMSQRLKDGGDHGT